MNIVFLIAFFVLTTVVESTFREITISAVGRSAEIGELYNAYEDKLIHVSAFEKPINPKKHLKMQLNPVVNCQFKLGSSLEDRLSGIDLNTQLSIASGNIEFTSSVAYINNEKLSAESTYGILTYDQIVGTESLRMQEDSLKKIITKTPLGNYSATHMILGIVWGTSVRATFVKKTSGKAKTLTIGGDINASAEQFASSIRAGFRYERHELQNSMLNNFDIQVHGGIRIPPYIPQSLDDVYKLFNQIPDQVNGTNAGKGKPVAFILAPILDVRLALKSKIIEQNYPYKMSKQKYARSQIFNHEIINFYNSYDHTLQNVILLQNLVNQYKYILPDYLVTKVNYYKKHYVERFKSINVELSQIIKQSRFDFTREVKMQFKTLLNGYFAEEYGLLSVKKEMENLSPEIKDKTNDYEIFSKSGVEYVGKDLSLSHLKIKHARSAFAILFVKHEWKRDLKRWEDFAVIFALPKPFKKYIVDCNVEFHSNNTCNSVNNIEIKYYNEELDRSKFEFFKSCAAAVLNPRGTYLRELISRKRK